MASTFIGRNEDQTDASSYSLASQATGTAGSQRWVAIWGRKNAANPGLPATCTVGGVSLTAVPNSQIDANITTDNAKFGLRWFQGVVAGGGNQTIAFTFTEDGTPGGTASTMIRGGYAIFESTGMSATVHDTLTDEATATNDRVLTGGIDVAAGGDVLGIGVLSVTANVGCTLTGIAEDSDTQESSANNQIVIGHSNGLGVESNRTVTFTWAAGGTSDDGGISVISLAVAATTHAVVGVTSQNQVGLAESSLGRAVVGAASESQQANAAATMVRGVASVASQNQVSSGVLVSIPAAVASAAQRGDSSAALAVLLAVQAAADQQQVSLAPLRFDGNLSVVALATNRQDSIVILVSGDDAGPQMMVRVILRDQPNHLRVVVQDGMRVTLREGQHRVVLAEAMRTVLRDRSMRVVIQDGKALL